MDEDMVQAEARGVEDVADGSDDPEMIAADKKGKDGDNIIAVLIG
jgi:hypothetical protein